MTKVVHERRNRGKHSAEIRGAKTCYHQNEAEQALDARHAETERKTQRGQAYHITMIADNINKKTRTTWKQEEPLFYVALCTHPPVFQVVAVD